ncbi:MAG: ABC transporter substrate-binding protein [Burkholderiales bacterium]
MRRFICVVLMFAAPFARAADVLHVYNWNDYIAPQTLERFKADCRCEVRYSTFGSSDELLAKLAAGASGYDVIVPTGNAVDALIKQKALLPLDRKRLPNLKNTAPAYLDAAFDRGNVYSVPYASSVTLIGYNEQKMKQLGILTDSFAAIFDPKNLAKIKGRVTVLDDQRELMAAALIYLGYSANDRDVKHWRQARDVIVKAKPYWLAFNNTSYIRLLAVGDIWLALGYSNDMFQANQGAKQAGRKYSIGYSVPREGAVMSLDSMVIHKSAPRPDLAHRFINFMLDGRNASELTNLIGSGSVNRAAAPYIKPEIAAIKTIFPPAETVKKLEQLQDLDRNGRRELSRLWTEIKLAD